MDRSVRGFTLIEVLVVVGIVSILVLILAVNFKGNVDKAKSDATRLYFSSLATAIEQYKSEMGVYPPSSLPGQPLGYGSELLRQALTTGINGTGKGDVRWNRFGGIDIPTERIGRAPGSVASYRTITVTLADGSTPGALDGVMVDEFEQPFFYINHLDYGRFGARVDTLNNSGTGETAYEFPISYQFASVGKDGKTMLNQLGGQSMYDNYDNDADGLTDNEDNDESTLGTNTPAEDDITR